MVRKVNLFQAQESDMADLIVDKTYLPTLLLILFGTDGILMVERLRKDFRVAPSTISIVSDRLDEATMNSLGIPCIRVRDGGFGTDAQEAFEEFPIYRNTISEAVRQLKNLWNFKLTLCMVNLCGGTSGYSIGVINDILNTYHDAKCLMFLKIPTSSFSSFRQLQNVEFFFKEYGKMQDSYRGRLSAALYSDAGGYKVSTAKQWIAEFVSSVTAALSMNISPVNALVQLCEDLPGGTHNQSLGAPFIIDTGSTTESGISLIEGSIRDLRSHIAASLVDVDFKLCAPYQLWGVLCHPDKQKTEKETFDLKSRVAGLALFSMKKFGLNNGFVTIEAVPFGSTWRLFGFWRGLQVESVRGMPV